MSHKFHSGLFPYNGGRRDLAVIPMGGENYVRDKGAYKFGDKNLIGGGH